MARAAKGPTYAGLMNALAKARAAGDVKRYEKIQDDIDKAKRKETEEYPQHFRKSDEDKARLLLFGWLKGGQKASTQHQFPAPGAIWRRSADGR